MSKFYVGKFGYNAVGCFDNLTQAEAAAIQLSKLQDNFNDCILVYSETDTGVDDVHTIAFHGYIYHLAN